MNKLKSILSKKDEDQTTADDVGGLEVDKKLQNIAVGRAEDVVAKIEQPEAESTTALNAESTTAVEEPTAETDAVESAEEMKDIDVSESVQVEIVEEAESPSEEVMEVVAVAVADEVDGSAMESDELTDEVAEEKIVVESAVEKIVLPKGKEWAVAAPNVNLSGKWKIIVTDDFKENYDNYLKDLGQTSLVRSVAVTIVEMTTEEVIQSDEGRALCIKGKNLRGIWDRTLMASGSDCDTEHGDGDEHMRVPLVTADKEKVESESWWENNGTVHRSWLRGVKKYGGGDFESRRFLVDDGNKLVCESKFHPQGREKEKAVLRWEFERIA